MMYFILPIQRLFKPRFCIILTLLLTFTCIKNVYAQEVVHTQEVIGSNNVKTRHVQSEGNKIYSNQLPTHLSDKYYRQALYYYFQHKPEEALNQLNINQEYFSSTPIHESLFRVGLQISQGLHQNAQILLEQLSEQNFTYQPLHTQVNANNNKHQIVENNIKTETLKVVVYLQLAEQKIAQHNIIEAKAILAKVNTLPTHYLIQYYIMQQLIHWPEQPNIENFKLNEETKLQLKDVISNKQLKTDTQHGYIALNEALSAMNKKEYSLAEEKLKTVVHLNVEQSKRGFWQQLFSYDMANHEHSAKDEDTEKNGIKTYAQLLLAQLYIEQGYFTLSYEQLEHFPKNTPFTEQALFLFGYSAFKLKEHNVSEVMFDTLIAQYPYGKYSHQAWPLSAEQFVINNQLNKALNRYLEIEAFYQKKQKQLSTFTDTFINHKNVLPLFASANLSHSNVDKKEKSNQSMWLNLFLQQPNVTTLYQQLTSIELLDEQLQQQQNKSAWLANTIQLNENRQRNIIAKQTDSNYPNTIEQLLVKKNKLKALLNNAKLIGNGELFANNTESKQLNRIAKSKQSLAYLTKNNKENRSLSEYKERLDRVERVLAWQLHQHFPARYWQNQHALNQFERSFNQTIQQYKKVNNLHSLYAQKSALPKLKHQHKLVNDKITTLLTQTEKMKTQLNQKLINCSSEFGKTEHAKISQLLLFNQRAMARVIEKLNQQGAQ